MRFGAFLFAAFCGVIGYGGAAFAAPEACTKGDGDWLKQACFTAPLTSGKYGHDILGDTPEWSALRLEFGASGAAAYMEGGDQFTIQLPEGMLFEDLAPRLEDMDDDGRPEIIAVQTDFGKGARLIVAGLGERYFAATPFIGQSRRWLAPIGVGDFDGDGAKDIAYIDRPHLAKTLRIWRYIPAAGGKPSELVDVARVDGVTNHRIGDAFIQGGICPGAGEGGADGILLADADWKKRRLITWNGKGFTNAEKGRYRGRQSLDPSRNCP
ncbi:MAG: FG-GAP repeat domain-containing protein [Paracoccaceae bacterium]